MNEHTLTDTPKPDANPAPRKPYSPPAIVYSAPLEVMAAVCNPNVGGKSLPCADPANKSTNPCYYGFQHS